MFGCIVSDGFRDVWGSRRLHHTIGFHTKRFWTDLTLPHSKETHARNLKDLKVSELALKFFYVVHCDLVL